MAKTQLTKKDRIKLRKRRKRQLIGLACLVLILIGVGSMARGLISFISGFFDDTEERLEFASLIAPIVRLDLTDFNSIDKADQSALLQAAIMASIQSHPDYETNEDMQQLVPAADVEEMCKKMYGPSYKVNHRSFTRTDLTFEYDPDLKIYRIPSFSEDNDYVPEVQKISTKGNTKILLVAYKHESADLGTGVIKYKEYVMIKGSSGYYLYSIREPESVPQS